MSVKSYTVTESTGRAYNGCVCERERKKKERQNLEFNLKAY